MSARDDLAGAHERIAQLEALLAQRTYERDAALAQVSQVTYERDRMAAELGRIVQ